MKEKADPAPKHNSNKIGKYGPIAAVLITVLIYFGSQLFAGALVGMGAAFLGYNGGDIQAAFEESAVWQFTFIVLTELFSLAILWSFMDWRKVPRASIGLGRKPKTKDLNYALITFGIYFCVLIAVIAIVSAIMPGLDLDQEQQLGFEPTDSRPVLGLIFIGLVVMPAIVEEIVVRGFLYSGLRNGLPYLQASISASLLFGLAHLQLGSGAPPLWVAAIDTFVLSIILIELRERTGALWSGMMVHGLKNGLAFVGLFILTNS